VKNWIGHTFFREKPGFVSAKGTTKKAEALEFLSIPIQYVPASSRALQGLAHVC
jgi:hypothetical protein